MFFKELKQTLQLADFLGHNANAVRWQVWTALLVYLLLRFWACLSQWGPGRPALCLGAFGLVAKNWLGAACSNAMGQPVAAAASGHPNRPIFQASLKYMGQPILMSSLKPPNP